MGNTWRSKAACLGFPTSWWFPEPGGSQSPARFVCSACPVSEDCLAYSISGEVDSGIWGGMTESERRRLLRRMKRARVVR